jgi:IS1 family transposase
LIRYVKYEKNSIDDALYKTGYRSRSSFYQFSNQFHENGFMGLLDLRPINNRQINLKNSDDDLELKDIGKFASFNYQNTLRPITAVWNIQKDHYKRSAFYGIKKRNHKMFVQIIRALVEGNGIRGTARIFNVDKNTVLHYLKKAAYQCRSVTNYYIRNLYVEELQLDEMWGFVFKKEKNQTENEYLSCISGDQWCWIAIDVRHRLIVNYEIGKRTYQLADDLIKNFKLRTNKKPPKLIMSDNYKGYKYVILKNYKSHKNKPDPEIDYVVIEKKRKKGGIVNIRNLFVYGNKERALERIKNSPVSNSPNVSFVERSNLSRRQFNKRLIRKSGGFSKKLNCHLYEFELETAVHNFVRPHRGLSGKTPIVAAGISDHNWSIEELLSFKI